MSDLDGCACQDCDGGCDLLANTVRDSEPICDECDMGNHRQDRDDDGSWPQPGDLPNMAGGHEHWDE